MKRTWTAILASALLAIGLLAGCSGKDDKSSDTTDTTVTETETDNGTDTDDPDGDENDKPAEKKPTHTDVSDPQGSVDGYVGAAEDASLDRCESDGGVLVAEGTVTNPEGSTQDYRIYVSAMDAEGDTRGIVQVDVPGVKKGETADWDAEFALDDDLDCLLRVERFAPPKTEAAEKEAPEKDAPEPEEPAEPAEED